MVDIHEASRQYYRLHTEHVQTKREIAGLLKAAGIRPRKRLGQHFLIDGNLMRRLVRCAELDRCDLVLEVGGGTGGLTDLLAAGAGKVVCVELDRDLYAILEDRFRDEARVTLLHGDVLESKHRIRREVAGTIGTHGGGATGCVKLVANLPYQVATPLVMNLLVDYPQFRRLCFTVQAEVGERITAACECKAYGPLSIISQSLCSIETVAKLPPHTFWPQPSVDSVMIRMDVGDRPFSDQEELCRFVALVRGAFKHRRKTLRSALGYVLNEASRDRVCQRFDAKRRPESFNVHEWADVFRTADGGDA